MKILFVNRKNAYTLNGGDTMQMENTMKELKLLGNDIQVSLGENSISYYKKFDVIHFFNMQTDKFTLKEVEKIKKTKAKLVLSPIWWDFEEENIKNEKGYSKKAILASKIIGIENIKILKIKNLMMRYKRMKKILNKVDVILPNSNSEIKLINEKFGISNGKMHVVYNGISKIYQDESIQVNGARNFALQVGRIEPSKNTLLTIKACKKNGIALKLVGRIIDKDYYNECLDEIEGSEIEFLGVKTQKELVDIYNKSKLHILPSERETPGLVSLEAGAMGCKIVSTEIGCAHEYFLERAFYCNPNEYTKMEKTIKEAWDSEGKWDLAKEIRENFTWENAAKITNEIYENIAGGNYEK